MKPMEKAHHRLGVNGREWLKHNRTARANQIEGMRVNDSLFEAIETNLPAGQTIALNPKMVVTLFGDQLLAMLANHPARSEEAQ